MARNNNIEPNPSKGRLRAGNYSWMNFMPEQLEYDKETESMVRFRGMFEMPNWDGVEDGEITHIVETEWERLDNLAAIYWGVDRQEMYWIIAARNNLDLYDVDLYRGRAIKIPSATWVDNKFFTQSNNFERK